MRVSCGFWPMTAFILRHLPQPLSGKKRNICYAEGFDPDLWDDAGAHFDAIDSVLGNGDMWESVNLQPEMLHSLMTGRADLEIEVTDSGFLFTARQRDTEEKSC